MPPLQWPDDSHTQSCNVMMSLIALHRCSDCCVYTCGLHKILLSRVSSLQIPFKLGLTWKPCSSLSLPTLLLHTQSHQMHVPALTPRPGLFASLTANQIPNNVPAIWREHIAGELGLQSDNPTSQLTSQLQRSEGRAWIVCHCACCSVK